ncbi:hypothetical protein [Acidovorax cavernicola]|uniref:Uncharacterized protein n=1 Tax=Acidovorax cavernicola TaxID=1675792 RepID=A0A9X8D331_9BURK|nr:hypothetical protein [Acidovorax cavernicola]RIX77727.1 hypothetical protein D3H34_18340 [Acidovorax cavernicola]
MASKKTKVVVSSNGKNIDHAMAAKGQAPVKIKTQAGAKYLLKGEDGFAPENVTLTRVGADLHITLEGETTPGLILEGYYAHSEPLGLYGVAEDGQAPPPPAAVSSPASHRARSRSAFPSTFPHRRSVRAGGPIPPISAAAVTPPARRH